MRILRGIGRPERTATEQRDAERLKVVGTDDVEAQIPWFGLRVAGGPDIFAERYHAERHGCRETGGFHSWNAFEPVEQGRVNLPPALFAISRKPGIEIGHNACCLPSDGAPIGRTPKAGRPRAPCSASFGLPDFGHGPTLVGALGASPPHFR